MTFSFLREDRVDVLIEANRRGLRHLNDQRWQAQRQVLAALPPCQNPSFHIDNGVIAVGNTLCDAAQKEIRLAAQGLGSWKKGPFRLNGVEIDAEWRSDWKWNRFAQHLPSLQGQDVLDIGCNNGYTLFRLHDQGAETVLGIDPIPKFQMQFELIQSRAQVQSIGFRPWGWQETAALPACFDTVLCMGILYHHHSPIDLLRAIKKCIKPGGLLVLETIVIPGDGSMCLLPEDRYAGMKNIWFLPTLAALINLLKKAKFKSLEVISNARHLAEEQRSTEWHPQPSFQEKLNPENNQLTVESHPAPWRAIIFAQP